MSGGAYFVTGTDTGAGKTLVAAGLLQAANARGWSTLGLKPVAAGGALRDGVLVNEDAHLLRMTASTRLDYPAVNPVLLEEAIAPHIAAAHDGRRLDVAALARHCRRLARESDAQFTVAEGAGGWLVPLEPPDTMADLVAALGWPVIMVVSMKLGCLNHALLTAAAISAAGQELAGWVATSPGPPMAAYDENLATLDARLGAPCIGALPYLGPQPVAAQVASYLDLDVLAERPA